MTPDPAARPGWAGDVFLRAARLEDAVMLDGWRADPAVVGEFNDFGPLARPSYAERLANGSLVDATSGLLVVERSGAPVGTVSWRQIRYGPNVESSQWNTGISLVPEARGQGVGWRAQRLLAEWLLEQTSANRVEASTDVENLAEQRSLDKAGFVREGVLRGAQNRQGRVRDLVGYALVRSDLAKPPPGASTAERATAVGPRP